MQCNPVILKAELTDIGCTLGGTPMGTVQPSDSLGSAKKHRLQFRWYTHGCSVTQSFFRHS